MDRSLLEKSILDVENINKDMVYYDKINPDRIGNCLKNYLENCGDLTRTDPNFIQRCKNALARMMAIYARHESPVYRRLLTDPILAETNFLKKSRNSFVVGKKDLMNKDEWYTSQFKTTENKTSGTTGAPFAYKLWDDIFVPIEKDRHYGMILREFHVENPVVCHMVSGFTSPSSQKINSGKAVIKISTKDDVANYVARLHMGHGDVNAEMYHISFDENVYSAVHDFCKYLVSFLQEKKVNVLLASGGLFEILSSYLIADDTCAFPSLVQLMSSTGDWVNSDTLEFLREAGVTKSWCDHMRCWDGGASFFTCEHGTYHIQEELSDVYSLQQKMISTDFFAVGSPFINYWNGDFCTVEERYQKCKCGRWYRPFSFLSRRTRSGRNQHGGYYDSQKIHDFLVEKYDVGFTSYQDNVISIEDSNLAEDAKKNIVKDLATEHVTVNFFTQPGLRRFSYYGSKDTQNNVSSPKPFMMPAKDIEKS